MMDQIYQHLGTIFVGWMAVLGAVALTAAFTERRWLERICIGVGVVLLAIPLLYLAGLILWSLAQSPGAISTVPMQK
jgi:ABC-type proline/glycine betaine transport system permease subunit